MGWSKGYRVNEEGELIAPSEKKLKCTLLTEHRTHRAGEEKYLEFTVPVPEELFGTRGQKVSLHCFVAYQNYGDEYMEEGIQARHKPDASHWNCRPDNIKIGTNEDNRRDIPIDQRKRKLSALQVCSLKAEQVAGATYKFLAGKYAIDQKTAWRIVAGQTYKELAT